MVSIFKAFKAANNPKKWEEAFKHGDTIQIRDFLMETSSLELGKRGLDYLTEKSPGYVFDLAVEEKCVLPELKTLAKKGFQALADDPAALDKAIGKNDCYLISQFVRSTSSLELGERGLDYLVKHLPTEADCIARYAPHAHFPDTYKCNLPELQESAKGALRAWADDPGSVLESFQKGDFPATKLSVEWTSDEGMGITSLLHLICKDPTSVKRIADGEHECNLPELQKVAKRHIKDWANEPTTLSFIIKGEYGGPDDDFFARKHYEELLRDFVLSTDSIELGILGLGYLHEARSTTLVDIGSSLYKNCNMPEIEGVARELWERHKKYGNLYIGELLERCKRDRESFLEEMRYKEYRW
ncbi:MAG: hypothetical protein PHF51_02450 [Candidatus ainarchaeum sp.]|nr:hypothetical protein [Candidatus ainarchaeum sp.]